MKKLVAKLCILAALSAVYAYGASGADAVVIKPVCCTAGNGAQCCGPNTCTADKTSCGAA